MRLSKKGWNNVLIFGILLIVFIFHFSQQLSLSSQHHQRSAISAMSTIVEIETPDYTITRIGRNWKSKPSIGVSSKKLQHMIDNWQTVPLDALTEQNLPPSQFVLKFFTVEQIKPIIVQLHQLQNDNYVLQVDEQLFLSLPAAKLPLFLGR